MQPLLAPPEEIKKLLTFVSKNEASDLHIKVGYPAFVRMGGQLRKIDSAPFPDSHYVEQMMDQLIPPNRKAEYEQRGSLDFAVLIETGDRFRINVFRSGGDMHAALTAGPAPHSRL